MEDLYLASQLLLYESLEPLEVFENFILLSQEMDKDIVGIVVYEGQDVFSTSVSALSFGVYRTY